jgi:tetratricopeptide (TPR) repeat protein
MALSTIERGAQFDPSVPSKAAAIKAFVSYFSQWQWTETENGFREALDRTPDNVEVLQWYSLFLSSTGRFQESLRVAERAKRLDPLSPVVNHRLAIANLWANNDDEARRYFERAKELGMPLASIPGAYIILLLRSGEIEAAKNVLAGVQRMLGLNMDWLDPVFVALADPEMAIPAVEAVAKAEENGDVPQLFLIGVWSYLQQDDRALDVAFSLVQDRPDFNTEFLFSREASSLRSNPRFGELVERIGLRRYWEEFGWPNMCQPVGTTLACL